MLYRDIVNVLRDAATFSSQTGTENLEELDQEQMEICGLGNLPARTDGRYP